MTTVTGYRLTTDTGAGGPSAGDTISGGASTASINTNTLTPTHFARVDFPGTGPVSGYMYFTGGQNYFVPDNPAGFPPGGSGTIISSATSTGTEGTAGADSYTGTSNEDLYLGLQGNDTINTNSGRDTVYGGAGDDSITAGNDDDSVHGGVGNDTIIGGGGNDVLRGNEGADTLLGVAGDDTLVGGAGADYLDGFDDVDRLYGGSGRDTILGGSGDDLVRGDTEWLDPADFASTFTGSTTTLTVANGADGPIELWWVNGSGNLVFYSTIPAGMSVVQSTFIGHNFILRDPDGYYLQVIEGGNQTIIYGAEGLNDSIDGGSGSDTIDGQYGNDTILGGSGNDSIRGGSGNDSIDGGDQGDSILGDSGADTILGGNGNDTVRGGDGNDNLGSWSGENGDDLIFGDAGDDRIIGGLGADTLHGGTGRDTLSGSVGDDTLYGDADQDLFDIGDDHEGERIFGGEAGVDFDNLDFYNFVQTTGVTVTFSGNEAGSYFFNTGTGAGAFSEIEQVVGTENADNINATSSGVSQSLIGQGGNDSLTGGSGNDTIDGGTGNDVLVAGAGDDRVTGGAGQDTIYGDAGNDTQLGEDGDDLIYGWTGNDSIDGGAGNDTLVGDQDNDTVRGGIGDDWIDGGDDNDSLDGGAGNDTIAGGTGNDAIDGGTGRDILSGGDGDDTILGGTETPPAPTAIATGTTTTGTTGADQFAWGAAGNATVVLDAGGGTIRDGDTVGDTVYVTSTANGATLTLHGFDRGVDLIHLSGTASSLSASTFNGVTTAIVTYAGGNQQTFVIHHGQSGFFISRGFFVENSAPPVIIAVGDSITGGNGNDLIDGQGGNDTIAGGAGNDTLVGGSGDDTLHDDGGDDLVYGGDGADLFWISDGNDTLFGEAGNDEFEIDDSDGTAVIDGGADFDTIDFNETDGHAVTVTYSSTGIGTFSYPTALTTGSFSNIEALDLTDENDTVDASSDAAGVFIEAEGGNDSIIGGSGGDRIEGDAGDDTIFGADGADTLAGGAGDDLVDGGDGDDFLTTGEGQDTLLGGAGSDTLMNADGDDSLDGGAGDDSIVATGGEDTLRGGTGNDTMAGGDDADTFIIEDGFGNDVITGGEGTTDPGDRDDDVIDLSALSGPVSVIYGSTGAESGTITEGTDTLSFSEIERLTLTNHADNVDGSASHTGLSGDAPGIDVDAGGGDDTVIGGLGGDTIEGGGGSDRLEGNRGDDSLSGGDGNDTIYGDAASPSGFDVGNDTIDGGAGDDFIDGGAQADVLRGGEGNDNVIGGDGNDTVEGGAGNDSITGGSGNDTFVYTPGDGLDTISDFNAGNTGTLNDGNSTNNDFIDLSRFYDDIWELHADQADDGILNQSNTTGPNAVDYSNNARFAPGEGLRFEGASADNSSFTTENTGVVCFTTGTAIRTPRGDVLIDDLRVGDLVTTLDSGPQCIRWIGKTSFGAQQLADNPRLRPILIKRGVLDVARDLLVSPQHGMMIGQDHLAHATHIARTMPGVRIANGRKSVTYFHLMCEAHEIIFAEGAPSESFYPGPMALGMMGDTARQEIFDILPDLGAVLSRDCVKQVYGQKARPFLHKKAIDAVLGENPNSIGYQKNECPATGRFQRPGLISSTLHVEGEVALHYPAGADVAQPSIQFGQSAGLRFYPFGKVEQRGLAHNFSGHP